MTMDKLIDARQAEAFVASEFVATINLKVH